MASNKVDSIFSKFNGTNEELATAVGVSDRYLRYIRQGKRMPKEFVVNSLAKVLRVKAGDLFTILSKHTKAVEKKSKK